MRAAVHATHHWPLLVRRRCVVAPVQPRLPWANGPNGGLGLAASTAGKAVLGRYPDYLPARYVNVDESATCDVTVRAVCSTDRRPWPCRWRQRGTFVVSLKVLAAEPPTLRCLWMLRRPLHHWRALATPWRVTITQAPAWGAKGDGKQDDTKAIQGCIQRCPRGRDGTFAVVLKAGRYVARAPVCRRVFSEPWVCVSLCARAVKDSRRRVHVTPVPAAARAPVPSRSRPAGPQGTFAEPWVCARAVKSPCRRVPAACPPRAQTARACAAGPSSRGRSTCRRGPGSL